jgi:hypothetical protein
LINLPLFDQSKLIKSNGSTSLTTEAEAIRLSNELRSQPMRSFIDMAGNRVDIPAKQGFDCETTDFMTMVNWLADTRIKKSESLIAFVHRVMAVRFPNEYAQNKSKIDSRYRLEMDMIESKAKNDISWLGEVGFSNMVRLDKSLTSENNKVIKQRNGEIKVMRK